MLDALRAAILGDLSELDDSLKDEASNLSYYHAGDYKITQSEVESTSFVDVRIVTLGHDQATLTFEAEIETSHDMEWQEEAYDGDYVWESGTYLDSGIVRGTAKVELDSKTQAIAAVAWMEFDEVELRVSESPHRR